MHPSLFQNRSQSGDGPIRPLRVERGRDSKSQAQVYSKSRLSSQSTVFVFVMEMFRSLMFQSLFRTAKQIRVLG